MLARSGRCCAKTLREYAGYMDTMDAEWRQQTSKGNEEERTGFLTSLARREQRSAESTIYNYWSAISKYYAIVGRKAPVVGEDVGHRVKSAAQAAKKKPRAAVSEEQIIGLTMLRHSHLSRTLVGDLGFGCNPNSATLYAWGFKTESSPHVVKALDFPVPCEAILRSPEGRLPAPALERGEGEEIRQEVGRGARARRRFRGGRPLPTTRRGRALRRRPRHAKHSCPRNLVREQPDPDDSLCQAQRRGPGTPPPARETCKSRCRTERREGCHGPAHGGDGAGPP